LAGAFFLLSACSSPALATGSAQPAGGEAAEFAFRNSADQPPEGWTGPVFALSDDYPAENPGACPKDLCTWLDLDVNLSPNFGAPRPTWDDAVWNEYIQRIMAYVAEGQDPNLAHEVGFQTEVNGETRWYHVPWMAYDPMVGREFVHGTTNERTAHLSDLFGETRSIGLHALQNPPPECDALNQRGFETWAVGMYNPWGGYALGQAWPQSGAPQVVSYRGSAMPAGLPFSEGTVVAKLLFTSAPVECAPFLAGAPEWQVNRHKVGEQTNRYLCERAVDTVRLIQMDVAVVDLRSPTRWVYGTFAYDGAAPGDTAWQRLVPVGLQWGSDPWTFPAVPESESLPAQQSVLNTSVRQDLYEHEGCRFRLAGPVDNQKSSCISCHAGAYAPPAGVPMTMGSNVPNIFGFDGLCDVYSQENANYFQNLTPPQAYPGGRYPNALVLDTSLQMQVAFAQYGLYNTNGQPNPCVDPE
jgi:hypothetical protein